MAENEGWKCPSCGTVWAPTVKKCETCVVQEDTKAEKPQLLQE